MSRGRWLNKTNFLICSFTLGLIFFYWMRSVLTSLLGAILLSYVLYPIVHYLEVKRKVKRIWAILFTYLAVGICSLLAFMYLIPIMHAELNQLLQDLPTYFKQLQVLLTDLSATYHWGGQKDLHGPLGKEFLGRMEGFFLQVVQKTAGAIVWLVTSVINFVIAFVLSFYLLRDYDILKEKMIALFPPVKQHRVTRFCYDVGEVIQGFVRGQLVVALFLSFCMSIGLSFLDIDYALLIGIFAGFLGIIPYLGPIAGALPATFLALFHSPLKVVQVILLFFLLNQIEGSIISPRIVGSKVGLHPLMVILAIMIGGQLLGILGMLLAVPLTAVLRIVFLYIWASLPEG